MKSLGLCLISLVLISCGSTTVKKKVDLPPLPDNHPVKVYTSLPNFRYEVICEIDITRKGNFVSTDLESYKSNIEVEARKCGTDKGLLIGLSGTSSTTTSYSASSGFTKSTGYNIAVEGYGIRQISEVDKITSTDMVKRMSTAISLDNLKALKEIIKDVNKDPAKRSANDDELLKISVFLNSRKGLSCSKKCIDYLVADFKVRIQTLKYETDSARELALCGDVLEESYSSISDRPGLLTYINNSTVDILNNMSSKKDVKKLQQLKPVLAKANQEILDACKVSEASEICLYKPRFQQLNTSVKKYAP